MTRHLPLHATLAEKLSAWQRYALTVSICLLTAWLLAPLAERLVPANLVMVFLLVVLGISVNLGRDCAVLSALLSVLLFDFVFVPPRYSLEVNDAQYLLTFLVMLVVALTTARMASGLQFAATQALRREARTQALYALAREVSGCVTQDEAWQAMHRFVAAQTHAQVWPVLVKEASATVMAERVTQAPFQVESHLATQALTQRKTVVSRVLQGGGWASTYIPFIGSDTVHGVLLVCGPQGRAAPALSDDDTALLEAVASLLTTTIERLHYVELAQQSQLSVAAERLRSSILSALSHDLRTPLTVLVGLADSLERFKPPLPVLAQEMAQSIQQQALQLSNLAANLLDMAWLQAGEVRLRREWQAWQEVVEASLRHLGDALRAHRIEMRLSDALPLVEMDAVLMARVLSNLLENAAKYAPAGSAIVVEARTQAGWTELSVSDAGPGFARGRAQDMFGVFVRGAQTSAVHGFGLGLSICRAIVEAHGGTIAARNGETGGACVCVRLPQGTPPAVCEEDEV